MTVAEGAAEPDGAPQRREPGHVRQHVAHTGGQHDRPRSAVGRPLSIVTSNVSPWRTTSVAAAVHSLTVSYAARSARAAARYSAGGWPSCAAKLCMWVAPSLR